MNEKQETSLKFKINCLIDELQEFLKQENAEVIHLTIRKDSSDLIISKDLTNEITNE